MAKHGSSHTGKNTEGTDMRGLEHCDKGRKVRTKYRMISRSRPKTKTSSGFSQ